MSPGQFSAVPQACAHTSTPHMCAHSMSLMHAHNHTSQARHTCIHYTHMHSRITHIPHTQSMPFMHPQHTHELSTYQVHTYISHACARTHTTQRDTHKYISHMCTQHNMHPCAHPCAQQCLRGLRVARAGPQRGGAQEGQGPGSRIHSPAIYSRVKISFLDLRFLTYHFSKNAC